MAYQSTKGTEDDESDLPLWGDRRYAKCGRYAELQKKYNQKRPKKKKR